MQLVANLIEAYRRSITDLDWMTDGDQGKALTSSPSSDRTSAIPTKWRDYSHAGDQPR